MVADGVARLAMAWPLWRARVQRISYGGVTRSCVPAGGVILVVAITMVGVLFLAMGMVPWFGPALFLAGFVLGSVALSRCWRAGLLIMLVCGVPAAAGAAVAALLAAVLKRPIEDADRVPGIPAALFAPALLGGGAFLVLIHDDPVGLLALIAGGALVALHPWHRFPPRLTLGASGVAVVACATGLLVWHLLQHVSVLALSLLWSFVWAEGAARLWRRRVSPVPSFELARLRGEPEAGLTLASLSLSLAGVVFLWAAWRQPWTVQWGAIAALFALQMVFCAFLMRVPHALEPPVPRAGS